MKSNKEISDYLKPYTTIKGNYLPYLVVITTFITKKENNITTVMKVELDIKSSWKNIDGTNTRNETIKSYLKRNGFTYDPYTLSYYKYSVKSKPTPQIGK